MVTWPELRRLVDSLVDEWVAKLEKAGQLSAARPVVAMEAGRLKTACEYVRPGGSRACCTTA